MEHSTKVTAIKGVGDKAATLYKRMGIETAQDLIYHFPRRYEDYSKILKIGEIVPGPVTLKVKVDSVNARYVRRGLHITEAVVGDGSGQLKVVWFNQPYRKQAIRGDRQYFVSGEYELSGDRYQITNPSMELVSSFPKNTARIVPVYPETKGLKSHQIRKHVKEILPLIDKLEETLPEVAIEMAKVIPHSRALRNLHFPASSQVLNEAKDRLGFEELYEITLAGLLNRQDLAKKRGLKIKFEATEAKKFVDSLEFNLTDAQRKAAWQVLQDIDALKPMNRLVEGDVGSGKSVVAALAVLMAARAGYQAAYMAPTEILARQQYQALGKMLTDFNVKTELYISALPAKDKSVANQAIESGQADLIIGTHALIEKHPKFNKLALVVIDEQHRFGVNQREKLLGKALKTPHVLTMTATPIPRTLSLTLYGELDVSVIDELPPGRQPVATRIVTPANRAEVYKTIDEQINVGRQAYVICPLVDESDTLGVKSVKAEAERLDKGPFKRRKVAMLHGKLKSAEKEVIMRGFEEGRYDILVSTTVVEVGVNVPNATIMLVEGAERFGLAQLHQLRGRIRRSSFKPLFFMMTSEVMAPPKRLHYVASTDDGFRLAELDLRLRGPGEIYGRRQHGELDLKMANLTDLNQIKRAKQAAEKTIEAGLDLLQYPRLSARVNNLRKITNLN